MENRVLKFLYRLISLSSLYLLGREAWKRVAKPGPSSDYSELWVVFNGPPGPDSSFVDLQTPNHESVEIERPLRWRPREDGLWELGPFSVVSKIEDPLMAKAKEFLPSLKMRMAGG
jgi:hypothetical protein